MLICSLVNVSAAPGPCSDAGITRTMKKGQISDRLFSDCGSGTGTLVEPFQKFQKVGHSCAGFGREFEHLHTRPHGLNVSSCECLIKFHGGGEIRFGDDGNVRAVEDCRIL